MLAMWIVLLLAAVHGVGCSGPRCSSSAGARCSAIGREDLPMCAEDCIDAARLGLVSLASYLPFSVLYGMCLITNCMLAFHWYLLQ